MVVNFDVFGGLLGLGNFYNKGRRMNREKIIQFAHESHLDVYGLGKDYAKFADALERFAKLVAEHEREACVKIVESEAMQYAEPIWAFEIVNDIKARKQA